MPLQVFLARAESFDGRLIDRREAGFRESVLEFCERKQLLAEEKAVMEAETPETPEMQSFQNFGRVVKQCAQGGPGNRKASSQAATDVRRYFLKISKSVSEEEEKMRLNAVGHVTAGKDRGRANVQLS